jgi:hypothetical protein
VRSYDPGTREDGVQRCLGGHFLRQEVSVKIQYAQKLSKLPDGLGRGEGLQMLVLPVIGNLCQRRNQDRLPHEHGRHIYWF